MLDSTKSDTKYTRATYILLLGLLSILSRRVDGKDKNLDYFVTK